MLAYAAPWADIPGGAGHTHFAEYPVEAIVDWHQRHGLYVD